MELPVVDVAPLLARSRERAASAEQIGAACRGPGFFYVTGHGVDRALIARLERASRAFFSQSLDEKLEIAMSKGGRAWRGYFPVGGELTSGRPDRKEGLYFGAEIGADDPRALRGIPLHGPNLFPDRVPELRATVHDYMAATGVVAEAVMEGIALSLGLDDRYFSDRLGPPLELFRIFNYPPDSERDWGVGEHTDYGVLTLLQQDGTGGLQVHAPDGWVDAPPLGDAFVCNIGDMLDRMTGGLYRSTPHRVRNLSARPRLSFPFFYDPNWSARVAPIAGLPQPTGGRAERWDGADVHAFFGGTYGDYLLGKVGRVFPRLLDEVL